MSARPEDSGAARSPEPAPMPRCSGAAAATAVAMLQRQRSRHARLTGTVRSAVSKGRKNEQTGEGKVGDKGTKQKEQKQQLGGAATAQAVYEIYINIYI